MRLKISTALLVLARVLAGWPVMARTCGMSCCAPTTAVEVQMTQDMPGCCCCSDGKGNCGWERATHEREPLVAVSSEQRSSQTRFDRALVLPAFLQITPLQTLRAFGRFQITSTGPPLPSDRTTMFQVMIC